LNFKKKPDAVHSYALYVKLRPPPRLSKVDPQVKMQLVFVRIYAMSLKNMLLPQWQFKAAAMAI
jgi:hypothetical protein